MTSKRRLPVSTHENCAESIKRVKANDVNSAVESSSNNPSGPSDDITSPAFNPNAQEQLSTAYNGKVFACAHVFKSSLNIYGQDGKWRSIIQIQPGHTVSLSRFFGKFLVTVSHQGSVQCNTMDGEVWRYDSSESLSGIAHVGRVPGTELFILRLFRHLHIFHMTKGFIGVISIQTGEFDSWKSGPLLLHQDGSATIYFGPVPNADATCYDGDVDDRGDTSETLICPECDLRDDKYEDGPCRGLYCKCLTLHIKDLSTRVQEVVQGDNEVVIKPEHKEFVPTPFESAMHVLSRNALIGKNVDGSVYVACPLGRNGLMCRMGNDAKFNFATSISDDRVLTSGKNVLGAYILSIWDISTGECVRQFSFPYGPVVYMTPGTLHRCATMTTEDGDHWRFPIDWSKRTTTEQPIWSSPNWRRFLI